MKRELRPKILLTNKVLTDTTVQLSQASFFQGLITRAVNPTDKGKRLIVLHIGFEDGFVSEGFLCFESKKKKQ